MKRLTSMCALVGVTALALGTGGCRPKDDADEYRAGVPLRETVALHLPGAADSGGALTIEGGVQSALMGQKADMYVVTRLVTAVVNGGTWAVLTLVRTVVAYPPTTIDKKAETAVWGPYTDPLSPNTWRLTVTRLAPHEFQWMFEGRDKTEGDDKFRVIISGTHTAIADAQGDHIEGFGSGKFTIDWNKAAELREHDDNVGVAAFTYSHLLSDPVISIDVDFTGIRDNDDPAHELFNAKYRYTRTLGAGGQLRYADDKAHGAGTALEHGTWESRWTEDGVGRGDLQLSGGDLGAIKGHASECWDSNFLSVYRYVEYPSPGDPGNWGAESACTAFPTAEYGGL